MKIKTIIKKKSQNYKDYLNFFTIFIPIIIIIYIFFSEIKNGSSATYLSSLISTFNLI